MAVAAAVIVATVLLENDDRLLLPGLEQFGSDERAFDERSTDGVANHQHLVEGDDGASFGIELFNLENVVGGNLVLLATGLDHGESHSLTGSVKRPVPLCRALRRRRAKAHFLRPSISLPG
ncbi:hypothetical protein FQZ97_980450 [compost metagenome]